MVKMEVAADDFIIFDTDPDDRHLWTPITVQRRYMCKWTGANEVSNRFWNCHSLPLQRSVTHNHIPRRRTPQPSRHRDHLSETSIPSPTTAIIGNAALVASLICRSDSADRWLASLRHSSLIQTELSSLGSFAMMYFRHPGIFLEPFNNMSTRVSRVPGNATILVFSENISLTSTLLRRTTAFGCDSVRAA